MHGRLHARPVSERDYSSLWSTRSSLRTDDDVHGAIDLMRENAVGRMPVVDSDGRLRGIVSLDDLAAESLHSLRVAINRELANRLGEAFVSICARRACTSLGDHIADLTNERLRMVRQIAARGVRDPAVLEAMRRVRRSGGGKWRSD